MTCLSLSLFGPQQVTLAGHQLAGLATNKIRALLFYLAVEQDRPHQRSALAGLLWPEVPEAAALHSLSQSLCILRQALGDRHAANPFLLVTRQAIQFRAGSDHRLDVAVFSTLLREGSGSSDRPLSDAEVAQLQQAVALYRGNFLAQFFLANNTPFEEWALLKREHYHRAAMAVLHQLALHYERRRDYGAAAEQLCRQIAFERWHEAAYYHLMQVLARDGQRGAALACYESCRQALSAELGMAPSFETTALYTRIAAGDLGSDRLPLRDRGQPDTGPARPALRSHNMPLLAAPLIGRECELTLIAARVADPHCRLLTLTGPGGAGKTALAIQLGRQILAEAPASFADGVYLIAYTPASTAASDSVAQPCAAGHDEILTPLANTLGIALESRRDPLEQICAFLRDRQILLIIDTFEHLIGKVALLTDILRAAPGVKLVVTSRERLHVQEEWVVPIAGLATHTTMQTFQQTVGKQELVRVENSAAAQLFLRQVQRLHPNFTPDDRDRRDIARICDLVGGLPLGIQLAAAWVPTLSCCEIAIEIEQGLDILQTSLHDSAERHQSMRAVLRHSWQLLSEVEQRALAVLSSIRGGFQREEALQLASVSLFLLASLESKSLLQRNARTQRYELHEPLRQYAAEQLLAWSIGHEYAGS